VGSARRDTSVIGSAASDGASMLRIADAHAQQPEHEYEQVSNLVHRLVLYWF
jgi:hypothetical protein